MITAERDFNHDEQTVYGGDCRSLKPVALRPLRQTDRPCLTDRQITAFFLRHSSTCPWAIPLPPVRKSKQQSAGSSSPFHACRIDAVGRAIEVYSPSIGKFPCA